MNGQLSPLFGRGDGSTSLRSSAFTDFEAARLATTAV